ncbi:MAG: sodium-independent anion transporter [Fibrobacteres bacterium]|nr:sodium-independent anion transporter [Fibrobacterota bacterium]
MEPAPPTLEKDMPRESVESRVLPRTALRPKILTALKGYDRAAFLNDLMAGAIVGIVALPLAIAFAIASGVSPERGLITAVVGGFLISCLSGSRVQIGGPTGAFVVIVAGIVQKYGMDGLMIATLMAGAMLVAMGVAGFGSFIKFIPHPVTVGFTSGIAVIIFSSQVKDLGGLSMASVPSGFLAKWSAYAAAAPTFNPAAAAIAAACILIIALWPKVSRRIPGSLIALVLATAVVQVFGLQVETIGSRFGSIPSSLPFPHLPHATWSEARDLFRPAMTIALLAGIESLLCATVADGMIGGRHRSNMELVAQGIANLASPLFGGIPATGAIARTATNVKNGGRTPIAGIVHSLVLLLIMMVFGRWAALIPLPALGAILVVVAYNMSEWRTFKALLRSPRSDVIVLLTTFGLTVAVDLTVAIEAGMLVSLMFFMKDMSESVRIQALTRALRDEKRPEIEPEVWAKEKFPKGVEVFDVQGPLFFGAAQRFEETLAEVGAKPKAVILRIREMQHIDATGLHALEQFALRCRKGGIPFLLVGIHDQTRSVLEKAGLMEAIGRENLAPTLESALRKLEQGPAAGS